MWTLNTIRVDAIRTDARFQRRDAVSTTRLVDMEAAGRTCCGESFCQHRYEPVEVWKGAVNGEPPGLYLLAGHHRLELARRAGREAIEGRVALDEPLAWATDYAARSNARTRPYEPLEEAAIYRDLAARGLSWEAIGRELDGRDPGYYRRREGLAYLAPGVQAAVRDGTLRVEYAEAIGEAARAGAGPAVQAILVRLARTTGRRIEVFRAAVRQFAAAGFAEPTATAAGRDDRQASLFDGETPDELAARVEGALRAASAAFAERDRWRALARAGQAVLRAEPLPDGAVVAIVDLARARASAVDRRLGLTDDPHNPGDGSTENVGSAAVAELARDAEPEVAVVARPLLKWAGGKRDSLPSILPIVRRALRAGTGRLVEPFAGSAAVTLAVGPRSGLLADTIPDLAALYEAVRTDAEGVYEHLRDFASQGTDRETYERIRANVPAAPEAAAARLVYLNRTCFNGLYRVNRRGEFNVPHGKRSDGSDPTPNWPTLADFVTAGRALRAVSVVPADWHVSLAGVRPGDTIYADPPYEGSYDGYGLRWSAVDHDALAAELRQHAIGGRFVVVSQPDTPSARARFGGAPWTILDLPRPKGYRIGGRGSRRGATGELLIHNVPETSNVDR